MAGTSDGDLPLDLALPNGSSGRRHRWFRKRYLLILLIPVFMFLGGVMGMYFQPVPLQKFYALTGLQPGAGSDSPIALPPNIELPAQMAETMLPSDVVGLARVMPRGDVSVVAAPYGAGDARLSELLVGVGDRSNAVRRWRGWTIRPRLKAPFSSPRRILRYARPRFSRPAVRSCPAATRRRRRSTRRAPISARPRPISSGPKSSPAVAWRPVRHSIRHAPPRRMPR